MNLLETSSFHALVDEVLTSAGRKPLDQPNRSIVEVKDDDRVLQILAGPGSGKTEMLVWRVLYELVVRRTPAHRVMVTTFTRKAATEIGVRLVERSDLLLAAARRRGIHIPDPRVHDLRVGTIHSLCDRLLAEFDVEYMESGTQLIDETEVLIRLMRNHRWLFRESGAPKGYVDRLLAANELVALFRPPWDDHDRWPGNIAQRMQYLTRLLGQHTETWIPRCSAQNTLNGVEVVHGKSALTHDLIKIQERWVKYLNDQSIIDFTTLQQRFYDSQARIVTELDHVLVDEFQDTNPIQFAIHTRWLEATGIRLTVVGDDDQAMYRFRGSDIECFNQLEPHCRRSKVPFRVAKLEKNWRSTKSIVDFSQAFKKSSVLCNISMPKNVIAGDDADPGTKVRMLRGPWKTLCELVASEIAARTPPDLGLDPQTACLFFSTSEKGSDRRGPSPARELRGMLEASRLRVYNARNKTAAGHDSPVAELLGLLSYLVDPVSCAPIGKRRSIEVWATMQDKNKAAHALTQGPSFPINTSHASFQKKFIKADNGTIGHPSPERKLLLDYLDKIRERLVDATQQAKVSESKPRLTLAGLVARLLSLPRYRNSGYTVSLFRQALFTELLESNIAPTRRTKSPIDRPLTVEKINGKYQWPDEYWNFLGTFGSFLSETDLDDPEVEAFQDNAIVLLTFHQAKGLEFEHIYIAGTGRNVTPHSVLQTLVFSGKAPRYILDGHQPESSESDVLALSTADRDRELYVAVTRAKKTLTFLHDPSHSHALMGLHEVVAALFKNGKVRKCATNSSVEVLEWQHA